MRLRAVDVARGVAALLMIQTHAYDGWVAEAARGSLAYRITRTLGTYPLPAFLLLSGLGLALRVERGASVEVRHHSMRTGLRVFATGYVLAFLYALLDGGLTTTRLLHVDILHAIGLSLLVLAWLGVARRVSLARSSMAASALVVVLCPLLTRLGHASSGTFRYLLAPLVEVPGLSPMPLVPLLAFAGLGVVLGPRLVRTRHPGWALAGWGFVVALAQLAIAVVTDGGYPLSRTQPNIALNVVDLTARAAALLAACVLWDSHATSRLATRCLAGLALLGRRSLWVYAFHLPFCYGLFARPFKRSLDMAQASLLLVGLCAASLAVAALVDGRTRAARSARAHSTRASS